MTCLSEPHGGALITPLLSPEHASALRAQAFALPAWTLSSTALAQFELLISGALTPLTGYMDRQQYDSVEATSRLVSGQFWPVPFALQVTENFAQTLKLGSSFTLREEDGAILAVVTIDDLWSQRSGVVNIGGAIKALAVPKHYDFVRLRRSPTEVRAMLAERGWRKVIAVIVTEPVSERYWQRIQQLLQQQQAKALVLHALGDAALDEPKHYANINAETAAIEATLDGDALVAVIPLPREINGLPQKILQAVIAKNFGCSHFLADRPEPAMLSAAREIAIELVSDGQLYGEPAPRDTKLTRRRGVTLFFTGLSGAGKSTIAKTLLAKLMERGQRSVTLLDGDLVRRLLSSELGYSREHRDLNILRIGYVASEITKHGGIAICAPIAPYASARTKVREMVLAHGGFIEIYVNTPLEECERRDRKGLYAKARAGLLKDFTGIDDPYEAPLSPEIVIDTLKISADEAVNRLIDRLLIEQYL